MGREDIIAVNGDPTFLDLVRELRQEEPDNVTTTNYVARRHDGIWALRPDLVIRDLVYGQQAGWDLLEEFAPAASTTDIPVVVTATGQRLLPRGRADPARYGTTQDLVKPFDIEMLAALVRKLGGEA